MKRFQRGWLRVENRKAGRTWVLRYKTTRPNDGKRVENTVAVGLVCNFRSEKAAWEEVERQGLQKQVTADVPIKPRTIDALAESFEQHEFTEEKSVTTIDTYRRHLQRIRQRWGTRLALSLAPLEIEAWLRSLKASEDYSDPTLDKTRRVMNLLFKHGIRSGLLPLHEKANPMMYVRQKTQSDYEAMTITPEQAFQILIRLEGAERMIMLLASATGLRVSECLGLQWQDVDFIQQRIHVRRSWRMGNVGKPKSKASKAPIPMHKLLAETLADWKKEVVYNQSTDWVFASRKLKGKQPRVANMLVEDYLRPAAVRAGILAKDDPRRFGFHTCRHSLATFLVAKDFDVKTVQSLLRHSDVRTTLQLYAHANMEKGLVAQGQMLEAMLGQHPMGQVN